MKTNKNASAREQAHTPGPWFIENHGAGSAVTVGAKHPRNRPYNLLIADIPGGMPVDREANARLIAAAPELLQAVRLALSRADCDLRMAPLKAHGTIEHHSLVTYADKLRAAIAKAEGKR